MAKDIKRHVTHLKSKVVENNAPKLISSSDIYEGEIAVNYAKGYETLSIKNESGETITFLPRPYNSARGGETLHPIFDGTGTDGGTNLSAAWSGNCADIKTLYDGLTILYKINSAGHASGDTLSINGGEPHKVVLNASGQLTTHYGVGCIIKLTYDSSVDGTFYTGSTTTKTTTGVWKIENYDSNTTYTVVDNTYAKWNNLKAAIAINKYKLLLTKNETSLLPVSIEDSTITGKTITDTKFDPFGNIYYYGVTAATAANAAITSGRTYQQALVDLRYSFNTNKALTASKSVYLVATPQDDGTAIIANRTTTGVSINGPISQTLPTTDNGLIYIYLGTAYNTYYIGLSLTHPIYQYKDGALRQYVGSSKYDITDIEEMEQTLAAGISDINERMAEKSALNSLASTVNDVKTNGISSRRLVRKDFTSYGLPWFISTLKKAVADQDLEKYGMKVGDYFTVTHNGNTYNYVIAGLNTMRGLTVVNRVTQSHVGIIVDTNDTHTWNVSGNTYQSTNRYSIGDTWTTGASAAGYANCDLHYYLTNTVLSNVEGDLGSANLLSHYKLYGNSINTSGYNRFGTNSGCTNSWAWYKNQKICALSEIQLYGSIVWSSSGYDTGEACRQLDVFRVYNINEIFEDRYPWLRDVASASRACVVDDSGSADHGPASGAFCVAALILFA